MGTELRYEREKKAAALRGLEFVRDGYVVGLGTGSTASYAIRLLAEEMRRGLSVRGIPTSSASKALAADLGIPLTDLDECPDVHLTIDGADEISPSLELIKGRGGALLREKVVAYASRKVVIIADSSKQVPVLGKVPLPVEVLQFAKTPLTRYITELGASVALRTNADGRPFITEEGNYILDCGFGLIPDPALLAAELSRMPGLVEHGLFLGVADIVLIGKDPEVVELRSAR